MDTDRSEPPIPSTVEFRDPSRTGDSSTLPATATLERAASAPEVDECDVCCEAMPGYVIGDLQLFDSAWLERHTEECNDCRDQLSGFQRLDHLLSVWRDETSPRIKAPIFAGRTRPVARFGSMDSPVGPLLIAVSDNGVCEIAFGRSATTSMFQRLLIQRGFDPIHDEVAIAQIVDQLNEYFGGDRNMFDVPVDLTGVTPFSQDVLRATASVPFGGLATYSEIARKIGNPGASRAVGNALGKNPIPVILPCHRIVPADRSLGKYTGGVDIKARLLTLEGAALPG